MIFFFLFLFGFLSWPHFLLASSIFSYSHICCGHVQSGPKTRDTAIENVSVRSAKTIRCHDRKTAVHLLNERLSGVLSIDQVFQPPTDFHHGAQRLHAFRRRQHRLSTKYSNTLEQPAPPNRIALRFDKPHAQNPIIARLLNNNTAMQRLLATIERLDANAQSAFGIRQRVFENGRWDWRHWDAEAVQGCEDEVCQGRGGEVGVEAREGVRGHDVAELARGLREGQGDCGCCCEL
jgi:hypothetical protein